MTFVIAYLHIETSQTVLDFTNITEIFFQKEIFQSLHEQKKLTENFFMGPTAAVIDLESIKEFIVEQNNPKMRSCFLETFRRLFARSYKIFARSSKRSGGVELGQRKQF